MLQSAVVSAVLSGESRWGVAREPVRSRQRTLQQLIRQGAVFRLHFIVFENDCDGVFPLTVNVCRFFCDHQILGLKRRWRAQN